MKSDLAVSVIAATFPEPVTVLTCGQCNVDDIQLHAWVRGVAWLGVVWRGVTWHDVVWRGWNGFDN